MQALTYAQKLGASANHATRELVSQQVVILSCDFELHTRMQGLPMASRPLRRRVQHNLEQTIRKVMQGATPQEQTLATAQQPENSTSTTSAADGGLQKMQRVIDQLLAPALIEQRAALDVVRAEPKNANLHCAQTSTR